MRHGFPAVQGIWIGRDESARYKGIGKGKGLLRWAVSALALTHKESLYAWTSFLSFWMELFLRQFLFGWNYVFVPSFLDGTIPSFLPFRMELFLRSFLFGWSHSFVPSFSNGKFLPSIPPGWSSSFVPSFSDGIIPSFLPFQIEFFLHSFLFGLG